MIEVKYTTNKNYKDFIKLMREAKMEDYQINNILSQRETFEGWEAITFKELKEMTPDELSKLLSYCWKEGEPRCDTIGISNLVITPRKSSYISGADHQRYIKNYWYLEYSDDNGDPSFEISNEDELIHKLGDGTWNYGLYKRIK